MIYQVVNILLRKIFKTLRKKRFKTSILRSDLCAATFQINNAKLYVPVVILSVNYNIRFLENIK